MMNFTLWLESAAAFPPKVIAPREDIYELMEASFDHGVIIGKKTVDINGLHGGVRNDTRENQRVADLMAKMTSPKGYWERLIVDEEGNVMEGQHRLEAARRLGYTKIPILSVMDLGRVYGYKAMMEAASKFKIMHPDGIRQIVIHALDAIHEAGSPQKAYEEYELPPAYDPAFKAAIMAAKTTAVPPSTPTQP